MGFEQIVYFCLACFIVVIVPGPTVTLIIANTLSFGARAGILNVVGTQLGLILMIGLLAIGFEVISEQFDWFFTAVRLIGSVYLIYLGYKNFALTSFNIKDADKIQKQNNFVLQGFVVIWSNPKAFLFLGAFIPQFLNSNQITGLQIINLGLLFMFIGAIFDSTYAIVFGKFRNIISSNHMKLVNKIGGFLLILLGLWLALNYD